MKVIIFSLIATARDNRLRLSRAIGVGENCFGIQGMC